jgi:hypothetical protein
VTPTHGPAEWHQRDQVWHADLPAREKLILLAFIEYDRRARGQELFPSIDRIAWQTGLANSTVRLAVRGLTERGILDVVGHVASRYAVRGRVARYRFHPDRLTIRPEWVPDSRRDSAPVTNDSRRESAPVETRQPPIHDATAADSPSDSRRFTPRQPPAVGGDLIYEQRSDLRSELPDDHAGRSPKREESGGRVHDRASREAREILPDEDCKQGSRTDVGPPDADPNASATDGLGLRPAASAPPALAADQTEAENDDDDDAVLSVAELQRIADRLFDEHGTDVSMDILEPAFIKAAHIRPSDPLNDHLGSFLYNVRKIRRRPRLVAADRAYGAR